MALDDLSMSVLVAPSRFAPSGAGAVAGKGVEPPLAEGGRNVVALHTAFTPLVDDREQQRREREGREGQQPDAGLGSRRIAVRQ